MRATTTQGREIDLKRETLDGLKKRLLGPVFLPGDVGYEESWIAALCCFPPRKAPEEERCRLAPLPRRFHSQSQDPR
jgi:hypothetical protein